MCSSTYANRSPVSLFEEQGQQRADLLQAVFLQDNQHSAREERGRPHYVL